MSIIYRIITAAIIGIATGLLSYSASANLTDAIIAGAIALIVSVSVFHLDFVIKGLNGEMAFCVSTGVIAGTLTGYLAASTVSDFTDSSTVASLLQILPIAVFGYVGFIFAQRPGLRIFGGAPFRKDEQGSITTEKILDTSVIIDGRILDIAQTNFIEGPFIIPNFVLREIQLISDSPDPIKRNRGRRGLDMLNKLQQIENVKVKISYIDYTDTREVDAKLVKLSLETGGKLITNDFNLNKVAELQGVEVLNLNNLTNALKPIVLPGEDIVIDVIKEGKDENQGIGYLEDGTMVVVENGRHLQGKTVQVNVTSIIQTAAGKMIFTRANGEAVNTAQPNESEQAAQQSSQGQNNNQRQDSQKSGGGNRRGRRRR